MAQTVVVFDNGVKGQRVSFRIEGHTPEEIAASVRRLGEMPAGLVSYPAKKSASSVTKIASAKAPVNTGALAGGIVVSKKEKSRSRGKTVYDVWMDPAKNELYVRHSNGKRYYYPASMEYGFKRKGQKVFHGLYYMRSAAESLSGVHAQYTIDYVWKRLEKLWVERKAGL